MRASGLRKNDEPSVMFMDEKQAVKTCIGNHPANARRSHGRPTLSSKRTTIHPAKRGPVSVLVESGSQALRSSGPSTSGGPDGDRSYRSGDAADRRRSVLVTGGAGFIGSHTVELLLSGGWNVRVFDNLSSGKRENLPGSDDRLEILVGDVRDTAAVAAAMQGMDACLHLAAQVSVAKSVQDPTGSAQQNIVGMVNVLEAARTMSVSRIVYASSAAVYGIPEQLPLEEQSPTRPLSPYGLEKLVTEHYADLYWRMHGISSLGLRYFNVYGSRQDPSSPYSGVISKFLDALAGGRSPQIFGDGGQTRDFVFVRDVARANVAALSSQIVGCMNVATGQRVSLLELAERMQDVMHSKLALEFRPEQAGDIRHSCGDPAGLKAALGIDARWTLAMGLRELIDSRPALSECA